MTDKITISLPLTLGSFKVPSSIIATTWAGENLYIDLKIIDEDALSKLCNNFVDEVYAKAGKDRLAQEPAAPVTIERNADYIADIYIKIGDKNFTDLISYLDLRIGAGKCDGDILSGLTEKFVSLDIPPAYYLCILSTIRCMNTLRSETE